MSAVAYRSAEVIDLAAERRRRATPERQAPSPVREAPAPRPPPTTGPISIWEAWLRFSASHTARHAAAFEAYVRELTRTWR